MSRSPPPPTKFKKLIERPYQGSVTYPVQVISTTHYSLKASSRNQLLLRQRWAEYTLQGWGRGEEPLARVQLKGQPALMSFGWPPPAGIEVQLNIFHIYCQVFLQKVSIFLSIFLPDTPVILEVGLFFSSSKKFLRSTSFKNVVLILCPFNSGNWSFLVLIWISLIMRFNFSCYIYILGICSFVNFLFFGFAKSSVGVTYIFVFVEL